MRLVRQSSGQLLVGTWAAAEWAIRFYQRHGFRLVSTEERDRLFGADWKIPQRQLETSVVLMYAGGEVLDDAVSRACLKN